MYIVIARIKKYIETCVKNNLNGILFLENITVIINYNFTVWQNLNRNKTWIRGNCLFWSLECYYRIPVRLSEFLSAVARGCKLLFRYILFGKRYTLFTTTIIDAIILKDYYAFAINIICLTKNTIMFTVTVGINKRSRRKYYNVEFLIDT